MVDKKTITYEDAKWLLETEDKRCSIITMLESLVDPQGYVPDEKFIEDTFLDIYHNVRYSEEATKSVLKLKDSFKTLKLFSKRSPHFLNYKLKGLFIYSIENSLPSEIKASLELSFSEGLKVSSIKFTNTKVAGTDTPDNINKNWPDKLDAKNFMSKELIDQYGKLYDFWEKEEDNLLNQYLIEKVNGKQSIKIDMSGLSKGCWLFCKNGYSSTGIDITPEQFDMLRDIVQDPKVIKYYEAQKKRQKRRGK